MRKSTCSVLGLFVLWGVAIAQQPLTAAARDEATSRALEEKWDAASVKRDNRGPWCDFRRYLYLDQH